MFDAFWILVAIAAVIWVLVGIVWGFVKCIGFLSELVSGERPASTPRHAMPAKPREPPGVPTGPDLPCRSRPHIERKALLASIRVEFQRALNLRLIARETYRDIGRYLEHERHLLDSTDTPAAVMPPLMPAITASIAASEPVPLSTPMVEHNDAAVPPAEESVVKAPAQVVESTELANFELQPFVPADLPQQTSPELTPQEPVVAPRDSARIRATIALLHVHAQAPDEPETPIDTVEMEAHVEIPKPVQPELFSPPKVTASTAIKKSWAERLFTPENVRILQSLGICIIFISAVAFVRTQMWNESGALTRLLILIAGTAACSATGYALRRWLSLRITGLGFLILGQLSLILDAYSALLDPGSGGHGLYPYSHASLWTVLFVIFTAMAAFKARALKEPLFDAFTYFGGLAAWGAGALWLGVEPYLLAASFVPALVVSAALAQLIRPETQPAQPLSPEGEPQTQRSPRWSLPWWLGAGFEIGAVLLAVIIPISAVLGGKIALAEHFVAHASALIGLALSIFAVGHVQKCRRDARPIHLSVYHAAALLLLLPAPLAAYAFGWTFTSWSVAFALPGAAMALAGLLPELLSKSQSMRLKTVSQWGLASTIAGLSWALVAHVQGGASPASLWTTGAALCVSLAYAVVCDLAWAAWMSTACSGFLILLTLEQAHLPTDWFPAIAFSVALISHGMWTALRHATSAHGRWSCEILASIAAVLLLTHTPILPGAGGAMSVTSQVSLGWLAFVAFAVSSSFWNFSALRRSLGIALAAPALAYVCYHAGITFAAPAPYLALLALAVILVCQAFKRTEGSE